jgi:hypothetical protein
LDEEQQMILCGWVLSEKKKSRKVGLEAVAKMSVAFFDIDISESTACRYLGSWELSSKLVGSRFRKNGLTEEDYIIQYYDWLLARAKEGFFAVPGHKLCSFDFVTNSRRRERIKTFYERGSKQAKFSRVKIIYTDTILNCVWYDGVNRTPALLFTYNPALDPDGANREQVFYWCEVYDIDPKRIHYTYSEDKVYCAEQAAQVSTFMRYYDCWRGVHTLSDAGASFKVNGEPCFPYYTNSEHRTYAPDVHGELSPNDNKIHPDAKNDWRKERSMEGDEVQDTLALLRMLDIVPGGSITSFFDRNFQLRKPLSLGSVRRLLKGRDVTDTDRQKWWDACVAVFEQFQHEIDRLK